MKKRIYPFGFVAVFMLCLMHAAPAMAQTKRWREITPAGGAPPEARRYGSAIYDAAGRRVIVFGGLGTSGFLNDVWSFDITTNSWSRLQTAGRSPDARFGHNAVFDAAGNQMVVWAGQQGSRFFNDTWVLNLRTLQWTEVSPSRRPVARYGSASVFDPVGRQLIQFAGFTQESVRFQDTQAFGLERLSWQDLTPAGEKPVVRCLHTAAFDVNSRRMIVYGGQRNGPLDDLWLFDVATRRWVSLQPAARPAGRYFATSFVDRSGDFIVFGGNTPSGNTNETWSFNFQSGQWTLLQTEGSPSARSGMMGAYIETENRFIIFGGSGTTLMNDVWELSENAMAASDRTFSIAARGAMTWTTGAQGESPSFAYARVQSPEAAASLAGAAFVGLRQNGVLVSETTIPMSSPVARGRNYVEIGGRVNTAVAIVNPTESTVDVSFYFTDSSGVDFGHGNLSIPTKGQIAGFLNEPPFNSPSPFSGTFTFSSSSMIAVMALLTVTNERSEFLMSNLPVARLSPPSSAGAILPLVVSGGGWQSRILLVNPTEDSLSGSVRFGAGNVSYALPPRSSRVIERSGPDERAELDSATIAPADNHAQPEAALLLSLRNRGITVSQTVMPARKAGTTFRVYAESGPVQTGLAITNPTSTAVIITVEPVFADGASTQLSGTLTISALGQRVLFLDQIPGLELLPKPYQGLVRITTNSSSAISVAGLRNRYNERNQYLIADLPVIEETSPNPPGELILPLIAHGGGYYTRLVLMGRSGANVTEGFVQFLSASGRPVELGLRSEN